MFLSIWEIMRYLLDLFINSKVCKPQVCCLLQKCKTKETKLFVRPANNPRYSYYSIILSENNHKTCYCWVWKNICSKCIRKHFTEQSGVSLFEWKQLASQSMSPGLLENHNISGKEGAKKVNLSTAKSSLALCKRYCIIEWIGKI